jgi:hypothetical protein
MSIRAAAAMEAKHPPGDASGPLLVGAQDAQMVSIQVFPERVAVSDAG